MGKGGARPAAEAAGWSPSRKEANVYERLHGGNAPPAASPAEEEEEMGVLSPNLRMGWRANHVLEAQNKELRCQLDHALNHMKAHGASSRTLNRVFPAEDLSPHPAPPRGVRPLISAEHVEKIEAQRGAIAEMQKEIDAQKRMRSEARVHHNATARQLGEAGVRIAALEADLKVLRRAVADADPKEVQERQRELEAAQREVGFTPETPAPTLT